jgi:hypothetical protein
MASTTFSGPVTSTAGFVGAVTGNVTGDVDATSLQVPVYAATALADIADAVNTADTKVAGTVVFDSTNSKIKVATGADANSTWVDADGTNAVTPS